jgi:NAD(P)-dependent dehydrogenase (short-subunit alcohol dehydrogenase family)
VSSGEPQSTWSTRPLEGLAALVTGAGRGLGLAAAEALARAGAEVWLLSRTRADLDAAAQAIRAAGGRATPLPCDVTDAVELKRAVGELPGLDIMVNNAGTNIPEPFVEVSEAHLDRLLDLNVRAAFLAAQAAVRKMLEAPDRARRGGAVINMTSQMGHVGAAGRTVYCLTKHALEGLTKALAVELAPQGIRVNSVAPTFVETPMTAPMFQRKEFSDWVHARIPLGRLGKPQDVAAAVVFLASPGAAMITGTSLLVDGGWTAQ